MEPTQTHYGKNIFVFVVIAFCLIVATIMGFDQSLTSKVAEIVADGLISLALFVAISFLASYSVDYSGILNKVGTRVTGRFGQPQNNYTSLDPGHMPDYYAPETINPSDTSNDQARG